MNGKTIIALLMILIISSGCISYGPMIKGHKEGQYFMVENSTFLIFSSSSVVEYYQVPSGQHAGKWAKVRSVLPFPIDMPKRRPKPSKPPPKKAIKEGNGKEKPGDWWGGDS